MTRAGILIGIVSEKLYDMMTLNAIKNKNFFVNSPLILIILFILFVGSVKAQIGNASCNVQEPWISSNFTFLKVDVTDDVAETIIFPPNICFGSISDTSNIIASPLAFATISMTGTICEAEISVTDTINTYPAGTFVGFKIGTDDLLAGATIGAEVSISIYSSGVLQKDTVLISSSLGIDQELIGTDGLATIGFISSTPFDEIRIKYDALLTLIFDAQVYHPIIQRFCSGPLTDCNEISTVTNPIHPLAINPENSGVTGVICVDCDVENAGNVINANENDFARLTVDLGLDVEAKLSVKNQIDDYPAGTYTGFDIKNTTILNLGILDNIIIRTYLDGNLAETKSGGNDLVSIGSSLVGGTGRRMLGFISDQAFDEIQIEVRNFGGVNVGSTDIYGVFIQRFCAGPALNCNELNNVATPEFPLYINPEKTGVLSGVCALCEVDEPQNVINADGDDFAEINITVGALTEVGLSVRNQIDVYPTNTYAGFDVRVSGLLDVSLLDRITIKTYLNNVEVESMSGQSELLAAQTSLLTPNERRSIGFIASQPFNEVQLIINNIASVNLGDVEVYGVIFSKFCDIAIECDTTFYLTNTSFPVIIDYFKTGTDGVVCGGNSVSNTENVINNDTSNFATITITAGAACPASIAVLDALNIFPIGSKAGFIIEISDELFANLGVGLFDNIKIETYLDGVFQESSTGIANLLDVEVLFLYVNDIEGRFHVGFETTKIYDEVRIEVSSLLNVANEVNVYSAFVDTRGATGDGFDCCPVVAPELSASTLTNVCDLKTVNLNSLETSTAPNNTTLVWFTIDRPIGATPYATPNLATEGSYYAFYYDSSKDCYTPASEEVVVTITDCTDLQIGVGVDETTPEMGDTITFTITITNNGPDGATNVVGSDTLPSGYTFVESSTMTGSYDELTGLWDVGPLAANEIVVLTIKAIVEFGGDYDNKVHVTGNEVDKNDANNHDNIEPTPIDPCDPAGLPTDIDCDSDGLTNNEELTGVDDPNTPANPNGYMTDPDDPDSDGDGVTDGDEAIDGTNPNNGCDFNPESVTLTPDTAFEQLDCDGDGVKNISEILSLTSIMDPCDFVLDSISVNATSEGDCDGDGVTDADEINGLDNDFSTPGDNTNSLDPCDFNVEDQSLVPGSGWLLADCDGDGVTNGDEYGGLDNDVATTNDNTDPLNPCDFNIADQGTPSAAWMLADCDGDGVTNGNEYGGLDNDPSTAADNTNPLDACDLNLADMSQNATSTGDCDGDGVTNADEINGTDGDYSTSGDNTDHTNACIFNLADMSQNATSTGDCDGDGVTNADEINGLDGDYNTSGDNTDLNDPCSLNLASVSQNATSTADCDGDGVTNAEEINGLDNDFSTPGDNTDSNNPCSLNLASVSLNATSLGDCDGDGVTNADEINGIDNLSSTVGDNTDPNDPCSMNLISLSQNATSTGDCDGDGVTDADEINGSDGNYSTPGDNTSHIDHCEYNSSDITMTVTANQINCNLLFAMNDINVTIKGYPVSGNVLTNDDDPEDDGFQITKILTGNPFNPGPSPSASPIILGSGNSLILGPGGNYLFTPLPGFTGEDKFSYIICDEGEPEKCDTADVVINVSPLPTVMNNAPIANDDNGRIPSDEILAGNVMTNDGDIDGNTINVSQVLTPPTNGTISIDPNGDFTYTPNNGFVGEDKVVYEICDDGTPSECDNAVLTIEVTEADDENEIYCNDDSGMGWSNSTIILPILENDTDPEGDTPAIPEIISSPSNGSYVVNANSTVTYTPNPDFFGNDEFVYRICDALDPNVCDTATVYLTVFERLCYDLQVSVLLEGPFDLNTGLMTTKLNEYHLLPGQDVNNFVPGIGVITPIGQPYNVAPRNYNGVEGDNYGDESTNPGSTPYASNITDWVLVSVREGDISGGAEMWNCAGMLASNGTVNFPEECPCLELDPIKTYHVVVEHRNHLAVMSNSIVPNAGGLTIDFTTTDSWKLDIGSPQEVTQKLLNGKYLMYATNGAQTSGRTDVNSTDNSIWLQDNSTIFQYQYGDFDLNADVNSSDFFLYILNVSRFNLLNF